MATLTPLPSILKLSGRVIRILGCNPGPMTLQGTNTYIVGTGIKRALIDTGDSHTSQEYIKVLSQVLKNENVILEHLIVTHWHHDHSGGVMPILQYFSSESSHLKSLKVWKFPRYQTDPEGLKEEESMGCWDKLVDGQHIFVEGANLRVKHTPGHTTDHVCLILEEENILFSGDCILGETSAVFEDLYDYMKSLEKILQEKPRLIYPGHGPVVEAPISKIEQYINHRLFRETQILKYLRDKKDAEPAEIMNIVESLYKETPRNLWPAAAFNVQHHLEKLLREKKVVHKNDVWTINSCNEKDS